MAAGVRACLYLLSLLLAAHAADLICPFGKILNQCNSDCYTECGGGMRCPEGDTCTAGCFCPVELERFGDICLPPDMCPDISPDNVQPQDKCSQYETCNDCISADPDCQWCPYQPGEFAVIGSRCRLRGGNPICPEPIQDPRPSIENITDDPFSENTQIRPQKMRLRLRAGEPQEFTLRFRPADNFPLDVYFLLDITGSFSLLFRETVTPLAADLVEALQNISSRYAVGFGGFGDKRAIPYALPSDNENTYRQGEEFQSCSSTEIPLDDCNPTISFRHTTDFSRLNPEELTSVLGNISIHLNVDPLEGGMDGLMQVLTCNETISWRDPSLRMLLYMTNAPFHLAGDGKVGAAFRPNPGQCGLVEKTEDGMTFAEYVEDTIYDYPSVYQLREMIRGSQTNIIFAVTSKDDSGVNPVLLKNVYQGLVDEIGPFSRVVALESNSSNLIEVIQSAYNDISQEVRLTVEEIPGLDFQFTPGEGCASDDVDVCSGVSIGRTVSFDVSVNMTQCLSGTVTTRLQSPAFGTVMLEIVPLCECPCNNVDNIIEEAEACSDLGDLVCGQCQCPEGRSGDKCECDGENTMCGNGTNGLECSGPSRGYCNCGTCECFVQVELLTTRNFTEPYFGDFCECDHLTSCGGVLTDDGQLCSGHGTCSCTECICDIEDNTGLSYQGEHCECDPLICYNEERDGVCEYTGSLEDLANAVCDPCDGCQCRIGTVRGPDGTTCDPVNDLCPLNEPCARCAKDLQSDGTNCQMLVEDGCNAELIDVDITQPDGQVCTFFDDENCEHTFYVSNMIFVDEDRACPSGGGGGGTSNLAWIIPVAVIVGLLVLGGIILLIVLLIVGINDRLEYSHFKKDLEDANWDQLENPMYVSPQQQYSNVIYRPKKPPTDTDTKGEK